MTYDQDKYEEQIIDSDEVQGTDIKINPDYYIHIALLNSQEALKNPDFKLGFSQFRIITEVLERLCKSSNRLPNTYDKDIEEYKKTEDYKESPDNFTKDSKLTLKKYEIITKEIFSNVSANFPLKM